MKIKFDHQQSAHCESGTITNLLRYHGITLSEAMAFGIGSGLFFAYLPFIKVNNAPLFTFRIFPGGIIKRVAQALHIKLKSKTFRSSKKGMEALDQELENGNPAALVTGVFHLPYFPPEFRFHFNAHHMLAVGKEERTYQISDPVMSQLEEISERDLEKARFAKGELAPKGKMYTFDAIEKSFDLEKAIKKGIKKTCREMLSTPLPIIGIKGIRFFSKRLRSWPTKLGSKKSKLYLGQLIRMLEEIGTGGAGFRFIYAAFLKEAGDTLQNDALLQASEKMVQAGDTWREFAYMAAKNFKRNKQINANDFDPLADKLLEIADLEEKTFRQLKKLK